MSELQGAPVPSGPELRCAAVYRSVANACEKLAASGGDDSAVDGVRAAAEGIRNIDGVLDFRAVPALALQVSRLNEIAMQRVAAAAEKRDPRSIARLLEVAGALEEVFLVLHSVNTGFGYARAFASLEDTGRRTTARLPDFIVVGPPRTATTWLHHAMFGHVNLPFGIKETDFFATKYDLGLYWYGAHFARGRDERKTAEMAPTYFDNPEATERIYRDLPGCRIVCTLRDPVARIYSHYRIIRREGWSGGADFEHTLEMHRGGEYPGKLFWSSRYATHVERWQSRFGRENVLVAFHEDLVSDPQAYIDRICEFTGVERFTLPDSHDRPGRRNLFERAPSNHELAVYARKLYSAMRRRRLYGVMRLLGRFLNFCMGDGLEFEPMSRVTESRLRWEMLGEIERLEDLTRRDLSAWKNPARAAATAP